MATNPTVERPVIVQPDRRARTLRRREREQFGRRIQWEAVFFGLLAAAGLAALVVAMVLGALVAAGVTDLGQSARSHLDHLTAAGGAIGLAILGLSYLTGGYVAARMARFDGWRQGLGTWLLSMVVVLAMVVTAWISGGELDPTRSISLPGNPIDEGPLSDGGAALIAVLAIVPLVSAIAGGVLGERFHRAVDRAALEEPGTEPEAEAETRADAEPEAEAETRADPDSEAEPQSAVQR